MYHQNQIEKYLAQVIRAFSGFTVRDGVVRDGEDEPRVQKVPVIFGSPSRVVAALVSNDAKFKNIRLPLMAVNLTGISVDELRRTNRFHNHEIGFMRKDGEVENVERIEGVPLLLNVDLNIYASSVSQLMELFEQVALTFNPEVTIQKSVDVFDSNYITSIRLEGISNEITSPLGQQSRAAQMSLQFAVPVKLSYPHKIKNTLEEIVVRVMDESSEVIEEEILDILEDVEEG